MTVSSTNTKNSYSGDGSTTVFAYTFKIFDDDDITVILRTDATGGETVQTKTTDYTVSGVGNAGGGNITFGTAPASGITVVLLRETAQTQATDYTPNDPFPAASHEDALDKLTLIIQDQQEELDRSIKVSRTNTITSSEFTVGATDRANRIFAFDSSGDLSVTQEIGTYQGTDATITTSPYSERDIIKSTTAGELNNVYICTAASVAGDLLTDTDHFELLVDAVTAATSATNAASSATAAAASETAAAASESAAATSESNAATSESNASTSAANAATSATASAASASAASTSETNAATSATNASTSATAAAASATAAAASETAAAASESAAATSETNAATSATNAATSETNAATSETNAATSATNAATSATNAATAQTAAEAARDAIQQFYLGAQSSNPTVDGNGDPVTAGDWYFNTTDNTTRIYDGSAWNTVSPDLVGDATPQLGGNLDTNGNDINFGDNDKAIFGAGSDLQIYHDGTDSVIKDTGTGNLVLTSNGGGIFLRNNEETETYANFNNNGSVQLRYDNATKFETTATGVDVTGTVTTDGLTVAGSGTAQITSTSGTTLELIRSGSAGQISSLIMKDGGNAQNRINSSGGALEFEYGASSLNAIKIDNNGDISFYDNTGVTQGFFWDADQQRLGLGETSPEANFHVYDATRNNVAVFESGDADVSVYLRDGNSTSISAVGIGATTDDLTLRAGNAERMRIDSSGNVGIGTSSPDSDLHVYDADGDCNLILETGTSNSQVGFADSASNFVGKIQYNHPSNYMAFTTNGSERMRIDPSGNVGIGVVPDAWASTGAAIQIEGAGHLAAANQYLYVGSNYYYDGAWKYTNSSTAAQYRQDSGSHQWLTAASGTADAALTWTEAARIDSSGNLLVGKTISSTTTAGFEARDNGQTVATVDGGTALIANRETSDGDVIRVMKDGTTVGSIGVKVRTSQGRIFVGNSNTRLLFDNGVDAIIPANNDGDDRDNALDLGQSAARFDDIYATNGTIQTSDANEKQQIASLTDAEITAAKDISQLFKTFKWNDSVAEKGDAARTHTGVIAQDVQQAMTDAGLDAGDYAFFISSTWWETQTDVPAVEAVAEVLDEDGNVVTEAVEAQEAYTRTDTYYTAEEAPEGATERTRLGVRYPELLAFIGAATEQRLANIETRLAALEAN